MKTLNAELIDYIIENTPYGDDSVYTLLNYASNPETIQKLIDKGLNFKNIKMGHLLTGNHTVINNINLPFLVERCLSLEDKYYLLFLNKELSSDVLKMVIHKNNINIFEDIIEPGILDTDFQTSNIIHIIDILDLPVIETLNHLKNKGFRLYLDLECINSPFLNKVNQYYQNDKALIDFMLGNEFNFYLYEQNIIDLNTLYKRVDPNIKNNVNAWIDSAVSVSYDNIIKDSISNNQKEILIKTLISYSELIKYDKNSKSQEHVLDLIDHVPSELINLEDKDGKNILFLMEYEHQFDLLESILNSLHKKGFDFSKENINGVNHMVLFTHYIYSTVDNETWSEFMINTINFFYNEKENIPTEMMTFIDNQFQKLNLVQDKESNVFTRCVVDHIKNKLNSITEINAEPKKINRI